MMNERGVATTDFLFALILVSGFSYLIFALGMTLTMIEVTQYVTFATARTYMAGQNRPNDSRGPAYAKYLSLVEGETPVQPLYKSGWFELKDLTIDDEAPTKLLNYPENPGRNVFQGAFVKLTANLLDFQIPIFGSTKSEEKLPGGKFALTVGSYLGRETTQEECENWMQRRWEHIRQLDSAYEQAPEPREVLYAAYDNGC
jgi:hypothetical protein